MTWVNSWLPRVPHSVGGEDSQVKSVDWEGHRLQASSIHVLLHEQQSLPSLPPRPCIFCVAQVSALAGGADGENAAGNVNGDPVVSIRSL